MYTMYISQMDTMQDRSPALVYAVRHVKSSFHALSSRSFINEKVICLSSSFRVGIRDILQVHTLLESEECKDISQTGLFLPVLGTSSL